MSAAPAMPVFPDAYLADTTHLTTVEHGAYFLLLMAMWRRGGSVPNADKDLARIVGLSGPEWRRMKKRLAPFLSIEDDQITQKRLQKEWRYVEEKRHKNAENGKRGGRPKANINNRLDKANGSENENRNESPHNPYPITQSNEEPSGSSRRAGAQKPRGFVHVRKTTDAVNDLIEEIRHDAGRDRESSEGIGSYVPVLPAIGFGRP